MEEKNELTLFSENKNKIFCSVETKTEEDKKMLFNALEDCDYLLNDIVDKIIEIKDVYCERIEKVDTETGTVTEKYRTIIFDKDGKSYATGAYGIYNVLNKIFTIYGLPTCWTAPLKVKVAKKSLGNGKSSLTLILV